MNHHFTLNNANGGKVFLPIDCVLKVATDTSDHPYSSKLKDEHGYKKLIPNGVEFVCPICFVPVEVGQGIKLRRCHHHYCKYVCMLKQSSITWILNFTF